MNDKIYEAFLRQQFKDGMALAASSDILDLTPLDGDPPIRYIAHFEGAKGLVRDRGGQIVEFQKFMVGIWFPDDYMRHVNIPQVLTYLGPHPEPWHPNMRAPHYICADIVPGTSLVDILYACYELWTWNLFYTGDEGLNHAASQWSRKQDPSRFPIDRRPLKRRSLPTAPTTPAGKDIP
jgi:hypothetical protein